MKTLILIPFIVSCAMAKKIKIVHYNIKELTTVKIQNNTEQVQWAQKIINSLGADILSLNEIQYDYPGVPFRRLTSEGENLASFLSAFPRLTHQSFHPANTGKRARRLTSGDYPSNPARSSHRALADQVSFGLFPGQYSTAGASKYEIVSEKIIRDLTWKEFNPSIDLTQFTQANGQPLPADMELFDKNFTDMTVSIEGTLVHVILLHTVPSYHFGNDKTPNYARNRDQMRFLEWYLTGSTDINVSLEEIAPLDEEAKVIAMGDWNTDINDESKEGSVVLKNLAAKGWLSEATSTHENSEYKDPHTMVLDYIFVKNLTVENFQVYLPEKDLVELGCLDNKPPATTSERVVVENRDGCFYEVNREYHEMKVASDHLPLSVEVTVPTH